MNSILAFLPFPISDVPYFSPSSIIFRIDSCRKSLDNEILIKPGDSILVDEIYVDFGQLASMTLAISIGD